MQPVSCNRKWNCNSHAVVFRFWLMNIAVFNYCSPPSTPTVQSTRNLLKTSYIVPSSSGSCKLLMNIEVFSVNITLMHMCHNIQDLGLRGSCYTTNIGSALYKYRYHISLITSRGYTLYLPWVQYKGRNYLRVRSIFFSSSERLRVGLIQGRKKSGSWI